jgi:pantoate ligase/cytidylate kinase
VVRVLKTVDGLTCYLARQRRGQRLGLVPTLGGLHAGHQRLMERAQRENDLVVVSIFLNPTQFAPGEDLDRYPQTPSQDFHLCDQVGVDVVFMPTAREIYGHAQPAALHLTQVVPPAAMTTVLCGPHRPGHFEGVATVVTKLLSLMHPDRAYFGYKDAQQLAIIKRLVQDLNLSVQIVGCPTVREADGLALSSRNAYLNPVERTRATALYRGLMAAQDRFKAGERSSSVLIETVQATLAQDPSVQPQYVELVHPDTLGPLDNVETLGLLAVAAHLGSTRLIDNILLRHRQPILAIDGPAGAGKSTVARQVAKRLGLLYLDSGAMYRAITWQALQQGVDLQDDVAVAELLQDGQITLAASGDDPAFAAYPSRIWLNGQEVTEAIRHASVTAQVSTIAAQPIVRKVLLKQQQQYGMAGGVVMEGRDIGTQVFPHAELKIFLTASVAERARRRQQDLKAQHQPMESLAALERAIDDRDHKDSTRRIAPLQKAEDAVELVTDGLSIDQVVDKIVLMYQDRVGTG